MAGISQDIMDVIGETARKVSEETLSKMVESLKKQQMEVNLERDILRELNSWLKENGLRDEATRVYEFYPLFKDSISPLKTHTNIPADISAKAYESLIVEIQSRGGRIDSKEIDLENNPKTKDLVDTYIRTAKTADRILFYGNMYGNIGHDVKSEVSNMAARKAFHEKYDDPKTSMSKSQIQNVVKGEVDKYTNTNQKTNKKEKQPEKTEKSKKPVIPDPNKLINDAVAAIDETENAEAAKSEEIKEENTTSRSTYRRIEAMTQVPEPEINNNFNIIDNSETITTPQETESPVVKTDEYNPDNGYSQGILGELKAKLEEMPEKEADQEFKPAEASVIEDNSVIEDKKENVEFTAKMPEEISEEIHDPTLLSQDDMVDRFREQVEAFRGASENIKTAWAEEHGNLNLANQFFEFTVNNIPSFSNINGDVCTFEVNYKNGNPSGYSAVGQENGKIYGTYTFSESDKEQIAQIMDSYEMSRSDEKNSPLTDISLSQMNPTEAERIPKEIKEKALEDYKTAGREMLDETIEQFSRGNREQIAI